MADSNEGEAVKRTRDGEEEGQEDSQAKRVKVDSDAQAQAQNVEVQEAVPVEANEGADPKAQVAQVDASVDAIQLQSSQDAEAQLGQVSQFPSDGSSQAETDQFAQQAYQEQYAAYYAAQQAFVAPTVATPATPAAKKEPTPGKTTGLLR